MTATTCQHHNPENGDKCEMLGTVTVVMRGKVLAHCCEAHARKLQRNYYNVKLVTK